MGDRDTLKNQLGGTLRPKWLAEGLVIKADLLLARVLAPEPIAAP